MESSRSLTLGEDLLALYDAASPGIGSPFRNPEVVEIPETASYLFRREDLVDGRERREQEELLPGQIAEGSRIEQHRVHEGGRDALPGFSGHHRAGGLRWLHFLTICATDPEITGG